MNNTTNQLTREGLFAVLGGLHYIEALLETPFGEGAEILPGVEQALSELEDIKEPLVRLLFGPPDLRTAFSEYLEQIHGIKHQFLLDAELTVEDELVVAKPRISIVKDGK